MKVELFDYTGCGTIDPADYAARVLVFTKNTRIPGDKAAKLVASMSSEQLDEELKYIARTVPSSWEFIDYSFAIKGVTRAFTHQLVRTRTASYAQEAMRILDAQGFDYLTPTRIADNPNQKNTYDTVMEDIDSGYSDLMLSGAAAEDARGILPTNVLTNICMKANLRTVVYLARVRSSPRVQGEYRRFIDKMVEVVQQAHPWTHHFFRDVKKIMDEIKESVEAYFPPEDDIKLGFYKLIDEVKNI